MNPKQRFLVIANDETLLEELRDALATNERLDPFLEYAEGNRRGLELAKSRRPDLIFLQATTDLDAQRLFLARLQEAAPGVPVVATFSRQLLSGQNLEEEFFVQGMRAGFCDFLRRPATGDELVGVCERVLSGPARRTAPGATEGVVFSTVSNKGGVGKSSLAVNLAIGLSQRRSENEEVLLIDTSTQMGVCASMLGLRPETTLVDVARARDRLDGSLLRRLTLVHSSGLHVIAAPSDAIESTEIDDEFLTELLVLARSEYRFVVVDTFPLFDRLTVAILDYADVSFVVLENSVPTVTGCCQFFDLLKSVNCDRGNLRVVVNRFRRKAGYPSRKNIEQRIERSVDYVLPEVASVSRATNLGRPAITAGGFSGRKWRSVMKKIVRDMERLAGTRAARPQRVRGQASRQLKSDHAEEMSDIEAAS